MTLQLYISPDPPDKILMTFTLPLNTGCPTHSPSGREDSASIFSCAKMMLIGSASVLP